MIDELRVGVVGTGQIGREHTRRLNERVPGCRVAAFVEPNRDNLALAMAIVPDASVFDDVEAVLASPEVDAMVVCSIGDEHEEAVLAALEAGKPVFCEKPLAPTASACARIVDREASIGHRLVQVGFMRRYDTAYRELKHVVESGEIGAPLLYHSAHRNAATPNVQFTDEMVITDSLVHDIDVIRWVLADEIATVQVFEPTANSFAAPLRDPIFSVFRMRDGAIATAEVSLNVDYGYDIRGEVSGERGAVALRANHSISTRRAGRIEVVLAPDWKQRFTDAYDAELAEWVGAARMGTATGPNAWDGYAIQLVAEACVTAAATGQSVDVALSDPPMLYR